MIRLYKYKFFGIMGVLFYYTLSLPIIRSLLFGEKGKILDAFDGEISGGGDIVKYVGQSILFIPYTLNKHVFSIFDFNNLNFLVLGLMTPIVYRYFCHSRCLPTFLMLLFLFFPAPLLFLSTFTKDTILVFFLFLSYGYYRNLQLRDSSIYFIFYTLIMRPYLFWVPLVINSKDISRALLGVLLIFILFLQFDLTSEIIYRIFNRRLVETLYVANSKIIQTVIVRDFYDILFMIKEVFPQIFFPIFFGIGLKSIIFQAYIVVIISASIVKRNSYSNIILILMFMYAVLDPDLGAYFRHITSFFVFFPMLLGLNRVIENKK